MNDFEDISLYKEGGDVGIVEFKDYFCNTPLRFKLGGELQSFNIRYETYGRLNEDKSNAILVCHALTGDHHCAGVNSLEDRKSGWWNNIIGSGKPLDTNKYFIICSNCIGGCRGTTGPVSINPATNQRYNLTFPAVTIQDMVAAQERLITHLGINKLKMVIGGSMGGMQVLQWAIDFPDRVERACALATTSRQNAQAIAFNEVGRSAIMQDPIWEGGNYALERVPSVGLGIARMMAHITYLSDIGMEGKFGRDHRRISGEEIFKPSFEVENYLHHQGQSFVNRFDANTYLYFTRALDLFDLRLNGGSLESAFKDVMAKFLVVGFTSDWLFPPAQNREIVKALLRIGKTASYAEIESELGHDSFLIHSPKLYKLIEYFLND
ncbi:MAG: homoserine O-acetyltransferase [Verrucomicrobiaceae bacterium]|nr:homoserine O-acetyltransferase [Verrucomicrobiaceae bacterium]